MRPAEGSEDNSGKFNVNMEYGDVTNIGVACQLQAEGHEGAPGACYITQERLPKGGSVTLTGMDKVVVWFQRNAMTGTMTGEIIGTSMEIDFTDHKIQTVSFGADGMWRFGELSA
jgi:hypothetical protein